MTELFGTFAVVALMLCALYGIVTWIDTREDGE